MRAGGSARLIRRLFKQRVVRYALVGGMGIPINMALLWFFHSALQLPLVFAWICAFEPSSLINFYANQRFTYHEQDHLRGVDWVRRALLAQLSSLSGQVVNVGVFAGLIAVGVHYLPADALGIVAAFSANFLIANRFVFTPARPTVPLPLPATSSELESVA